MKLVCMKYFWLVVLVVGVVLVGCQLVVEMIVVFMVIVEKVILEGEMMFIFKDWVDFDIGYCIVCLLEELGFCLLYFYQNVYMVEGDKMVILVDNFCGVVVVDLIDLLVKCIYEYLDVGILFVGK